MRILIIEDQEKLAKSLKKGLEQEGYAADYLLDGESGQRRIEVKQNGYDAVILDLMLPKKDGVEVCKSWRSRGGKKRHGSQDKSATSTTFERRRGICCQ
jgi:DNA-binding response OmpR family regulator